MALAILACGRDVAPRDGTTAVPSTEPDPIVIRIPRTGGEARAAIYPALDSVIWTAPDMPAPGRVLGFDPEGGTLALATRSGYPARIDLHLARATIASRDRLHSMASANGSDIFAVDTRGRVRRFTAEGAWSLAPPQPARSVFPQADGGIVVLATVGAQTTLWRALPPNERLLDTAQLPPVGRAAATQMGDRVYLATDTALVGVSARRLEPVRSIRVRNRISALAPTPSGDRVYIATPGARRLLVASGYGSAGPRDIELPGAVADLRMDALGRYLLVRAAGSDTAWVIALGTDRIVATVATRWTADLPAIAPDEAIITLGRRDVILIDIKSGEERSRIRDGARDFWVLVFWNGFRQRPPGLDQPVVFAGVDTTALDSAARDSLARDTARSSTQDTVVAVPPPPPAPGFIVSFAAVLSEARALALADSISIGGARARVVKTQRGDATLHRVVLGPYPTRAAAESVGRSSRRQFWIYQETP